MRNPEQPAPPPNPHLWNVPQPLQDHGADRTSPGPQNPTRLGRRRLHYLATGRSTDSSDSKRSDGDHNPPARSKASRRSLQLALGDHLTRRPRKHSPWDIENQGFNETTTRWHGDHVYTHDGDAILTFWLLCMLTLNVFQAFSRRNLKPSFRSRISMLHVARQILRDLYASLPEPRAQSP